MALAIVEPCSRGLITAQPCPRERDREISRVRRRMVLAGCVLASSMAFIDGSALTVALPNLRAALGADLGTVQWVLNGYMLALASLTLVGGALADTYADLLTGFYGGINDPLGGNPKGIPFTSKIFDLYQAWNDIYGGGPVNAARESIARGEALFNNTPIAITGVAGLNDALGVTQIAGFCGTCHDTPDVGNHSVKLPINIGVANGGPNNDNPGLDIGDLPTFMLLCVSGPNAGKNYTVTDPGRALISGLCADIGKVKGPILRGLAGRAPYFHNGSAATLLDVVNFYVQRFNINFTDAQKADLVAFLQTL
jgi:hypothetical protein